jgi:hypothetical protein
VNNHPQWSVAEKIYLSKSVPLSINTSGVMSWPGSSQLEPNWNYWTGPGQVWPCGQFDQGSLVGCGICMTSQMMYLIFPTIVATEVLRGRKEANRS